MAKKASKKSNFNTERLADIIALLSTVWFMYTVTLNVYDKINSGVKNAPASYALALSLIAIIYSFMSKKRLSYTLSFCIGILVASTFIWFLGLSTTP